MEVVQTIYCFGAAAAVDCGVGDDGDVDLSHYSHVHVQMVRYYLLTIQLDTLGTSSTCCVTSTNNMEFIYKQHVPNVVYDKYHDSQI